MIPDSVLLERCLVDSIHDFDSVMGAAILDSSAIGACRSCGETSEPHEPDATANHCPHCGAAAVVSVLVLAGVV